MSAPAGSSRRDESPTECVVVNAEFMAGYFAGTIAMISISTSMPGNAS
jgi:hypothetical protein